LLIKYIKSDIWRVAKRLSYIEEARCLKVNIVLQLSVKETETHLVVKYEFGSDILSHCVKLEN